ncbi:MAG TPA: hypothetical protein DD435_07745 [Cyanobacteria bacterium UBA8530]|nr:hypothetical protein [Cyanobacteria bacterium UBA8530]
MKKSDLLLAGVLLLAATPALAVPMKTSTPAKPVVSQKSADVGNRYRPTYYFGSQGVQRAQVLAEGDATMGLTNFNGSLGLQQGLEVGWGAGLFYNNVPTFNMPLFGYGKMMLANSESMSVAFGAQGNLILSNGANPVTLSGGVFLPISLWKVGPGDLHLVPAINLPISPYSFARNNVSATLGYELPINSTWSLLLADTLNGNADNALTLGSRVALTPNLTADLGTVTLNGSNLTINLVNIGGYFGGSLSDIGKAWGM